MENIPPLRWRDLTGDDVYHIAHLENEAHIDAYRVRSSGVDSAITSISDHSQGFSLVPSADAILANHEARARSWLTDQAAIRGLISVYDPNRLGPPPINGWLNAQITISGIGLRQLASAASLSAGYLSKLRNPARYAKTNPGFDATLRLANAIADARGLEGKERLAFIEYALTFSNHG